MKTLSFISFFIFPFLLFSQEETPSWAQQIEEINFPRVPIAYEEGLRNSSTAYWIKEDHQGIIWIGGVKGLFRFNGHSALNMTEYINNTHSNIFTSEWVSSLFLDDFQMLWIGTTQGLYRLNLKNLKCEKIYLDEPMHESFFRNHIGRIVASKNELFVGTQNGLYILDIHSGNLLEKYFNDGEEYGGRQTTNGVQSIYPNISSSYLWVVLVNGFYRINRTKKTWKKWTSQHALPTRHNFFQGHLYDSLLLMPSYSHGMMEFDLKSKKFSRNPTPKGKNGGPWNRVRSAIPINDSISLVNVESFGNGWYHRFKKEYHWLTSVKYLKESFHANWLDNHGFVWSTRRGFVFRSSRPIVPSQNSSNHIIDVSAVFVNGRKRVVPCLDGYEEITLNENERFIDLDFSLTQHYVFDSVLYEYQLNNNNWKKVETPHQLSIANISGGKNKIKIRAKANEKAIAERVMTFDVFIPFYKRTWFYLLSVIALLGIGVGIARFRIAQVRKEEQLRAGFERKLAEIESMALRSQINPHFIFNTLNSIKYYAVAKPPEETGDFINHFSMLIRQILENSKKNLIPLREEIETLKNYIEIEKLRFRNAFDYKIEIDKEIDQDFFMIPPSLIQPFVENSIWHGLMHKEDDKKLDIIFTQIDETIFCQIIDNGIGRIASAQIRKSNTHKSSLGMSITKDRIEHLHAVHGIKSDFEIIDLYDENGKAKGTKVVISFKN